MASLEVELRRSGLQNFVLACRRNVDTADCLLSRKIQPRNALITQLWSDSSYRSGLVSVKIMASPLEGCVGSLRNSMQLLDSSINILAEGVNDFPRLAKVLQTTRVGIESWSECRFN